MERKEVKSSQIKTVGHDAAALQLEIEFHTGHVYRYFDVTAEEHQKFITADSIGKHFGQFIRNVKKYEKVAPVKTEAA